MNLSLRLYALALDESRCVACFEFDGVVEPVCVLTLKRAMECGLLIQQGRETTAQALVEQIAHREAKKAIMAAKEKA